MTVRTVSVALIANVQGYVGGIATAGRATRQLSGELSVLGARSPEQLSKITTAMAGTGLALTALAAGAVKMAADFDKQMSAVKAVTGATRGEMNELRAAALQAGADTSFTATQAAKAEEELAKAGMSVANILGGGLKASLDLAAAGSLDLAEAADISAKVMNTFKIQAAGAGHVADLLTAAANKSATDVHQMGLAMSQASNVADMLGWSADETTAVLAAFADRALIGSDAGTSLKSMMLKLMNPAKETTALMKQLGISVYDSSGHFLSAQKLAGLLSTKLADLSEEERNAALAQMFGSDAVRAATVLYQLGARGMGEYNDMMFDQGIAARQAAEKTDNLAGDLERLKGTLSSVAIEAGSGTATGLRTLVHGVDGAVKAFGALPGPVQSAVVVLSGTVGVTLLLSAGALKTRQAFTEMTAALAAAGPAGARAAAGLQKAAGWAGKIGLIGGAALIAYEGFSALGRWIDSKTGPVTRNVDKMTDSLTRFAASSERVGGELAIVFGKNLERLRVDVKDLADAYGGIAFLMDTSVGDAMRKTGKDMSDYRYMVEDANKATRQQRKDLEALDGSLANLVNNGNPTAARIALQQLAEKAGLTQQEYQDLVSLLPRYAEATGNAAAGSSSAARGMGDAAANAKALGESWQAAVEAGQSLNDLFEQLNGGAVNWAKAEIDLEDGLRGVKEALDASNGSLDVHTEKGSAARRAILDQVEATNRAIQAKYDETGSLQAASDVYVRYRAQLVATMVKAGVAAPIAENLADQWMRMPDQVQTKVTTPGLPQAERDVWGYGRALDNIPRHITTVLRVDSGGDYWGYGQLHHNRWGGIEHAATGLIREAGIATRPMTTWAEPATGGEAYIPRLGDLGRSRAIAEHVVGNWLGGSVQWRGAGGTGTGTTVINNFTIPVTAGMGTDGAAVGRQIVAVLRNYQDISGPLPIKVRS